MRVTETERAKKSTGARVDRGADVVLVQRGNGEHMSDRHAVASGEKERQHDENRMVDIHIGKRRQETATFDRLGKKYNQILNLLVQTHLRQRVCVLNILRMVSGKTEQSRYVCRSQVTWTMTCNILRWINSPRWMDEYSVHEGSVG